MKCIICRDAPANNGYNSKMFSKKPITCSHCRRGNYPSHMKGEQYTRFWDAHNVKWRKENKR